MRWYAISGSWRKANDEVKEDVEKLVKKIILRGEGIITGGALGVDYIATQVVLDIGVAADKLRLFLPVRLKEFCRHYFKSASEGVITIHQAEIITAQLNAVAKISQACIYDDWGFTEVNEKSYYARNTKIVEACDVLYAFQVNGSKGVADAVAKAKQLGKEIHVKRYDVD